MLTNKQRVNQREKQWRLLPISLAERRIKKIEERTRKNHYNAKIIKMKNRHDRQTDWKGIKYVEK